MSDKVPDPRYLTEFEGPKDGEKVRNFLTDPLTKKLNRRRFMQFTAVLGASVAGAGVLGCTQQEQAKPSAAAGGSPAPAASAAASADPGALPVPPSDGKKHRIGNGFQPALDYWQRGQGSWLIRMEELGEEPVIIWTEPGFGTQIAGTEALLQQNIEVIVLGGMNRATIEPVLPEIKKRNIKPVGFMNETPGVPMVSDEPFWQASLSLGYMIERLGGQGNIAAIVTEGLSYSHDRMNMVLDSMLKAFPDIKMVAKIPAKFPDSVKGGLEDSENLIRRLPGKKDLQAMWSPFDDPLIGAAQALRNAGKQNDVFLVCCIGENVSMKAMAEGDPLWGAIATSDYWAVGRRTAEIAVIAARGGTPPMLTFTYGELMTKANAVQVWEKVQKQNKLADDILKKYGRK
ncbi:MAG: twin-arginine translocation signal domain-containing protein [Chloroflexota bacterium]|nr:MAG: twin-arginine translocation signal domain-containing protein [Chloroflexota bacterium]